MKHIAVITGRIIRRATIAAAALIFVAVLFSCNGVGTDTDENNMPDDNDTNDVGESGENSDENDIFNRENYVYFINVGYGDAILIKIDGKFYVIDTGAPEHTDALLHAFTAAGADKIEGMFITHTHRDHVGGIEAAAGAARVGRIYYPFFSEPNKRGENQIEGRAVKNQIPSKALRAGDTVDCNGVVFEILGPTAYCENDDNDNSLVIRADIDGIVYLFSGDMQFYEEALIMNTGAELDCDVLKVGNHGNMDATSEEFLAACTPSLSIISTSTKEKGGSASMRVRDAISAYGDFYLTEDYEHGVMVYSSGGVITVSP